LGQKEDYNQSSDENLIADGAFTGATGGETGLPSFFFFILLIPLISTPTFYSI
jgi:hypothetical protein